MLQGRLRLAERHAVVVEVDDLLQHLRPCGARARSGHAQTHRPCHRPWLRISAGLRAVPSNKREGAAHVQNDRGQERHETKRRPHDPTIPSPGRGRRFATVGEVACQAYSMVRRVASGSTAPPRGTSRERSTARSAGNSRWRARCHRPRRSCRRPAPRRQPRRRAVAACACTQSSDHRHAGSRRSSRRGCGRLALLPRPVIAASSRVPHAAGMS